MFSQSTTHTYVRTLYTCRGVHAPALPPRMSGPGGREHFLVENSRRPGLLFAPISCLRLPSRVTATKDSARGKPFPDAWRDARCRPSLIVPAHLARVSRPHEASVRLSSHYFCMWCALVLYITHMQVGSPTDTSSCLSRPPDLCYSSPLRPRIIADSTPSVTGCQARAVLQRR